MRKEVRNRPDGSTAVVRTYGRQYEVDIRTINSAARRFAAAATEESLARVHCIKAYDSYEQGE